MGASIRPVRVNHINLVLEDFEGSVAHFRGLYGADFLMDLPQAEWHACLIEIGRVIFEIFAPPAFLLNARHGPHFLGIEYQADMDQVRAAIADRGIRVARDIGVALHTHPADCLGVAFEFYAGYFHDNEALLGRPMKDARFWREDHPLGLSGLHGYRIAVRDIDAARDFLHGFLSAKPAYDIVRPAMRARCIGLEIADSLVELLTPTGDGALNDHLLQSGQGMHSTLFGVRDIAQARDHLAARGVPLIAGVDPAGFAIPAQANGGVLFEFIETAD